VMAGWLFGGCCNGVFSWLFGQLYMALESTEQMFFMLGQVFVFLENKAFVDNCLLS
jgi:hypothetical protein